MHDLYVFDGGTAVGFKAAGKTVIDVYKRQSEKSAPRAAWAFFIFEVSSISVGINRSAIVIIIENS